MVGSLIPELSLALGDQLCLDSDRRLTGRLGAIGGAGKFNDNKSPG